MTSPLHVVEFPFMSKGHTIPIFDLARFLLCRKIRITIFTTPANRPFFSDSLSDTNINIIEIPFPQNIQGVPPGVESTDKLPSMSLFATFVNATKLMKPHFEKALESLPPVTFMINDGFENRVKNRGLVVTEWVDQREILSHMSVQGFLSHCGWNSVIESICAKVPILAWPMMADQHQNARMVVEEIKIGLRVETCNGSVRGFMKWEGLEKSAKELMEGDKGKEARKKVKEIGEAAINAVKEGGSSWQTLKELINEFEFAERRQGKKLSG